MLLRTGLALPLAVLLAVTAGGCKGWSDDLPVASGRFPPNVSLSLGPTETILVAEHPTGGDSALVLAGSGQQMWVILARLEAPLMWAARHGDGWSAFSPLPMPGWKFVNKITGVVDADGNPWVAWSGYDERNGEAIAVSKWTGQGWSPLQIIDRITPCVFITQLLMLADGAGRIHLVYDGALTPPEDYARGFIVVDGEFPHKCIHIYFDGKNWTSPVATTGRGRFGLTPMSLRLRADGSIQLTQTRRKFGLVDGFEYAIVRQIWNGTSWSSPDVLRDCAQPVYEGDSIRDRWGATITCWSGEQSLEYQFSRPGQDPTLGTYDVGRYGTTFLSHPSGRIIRFTEKYGLAAWNGQHWSTALRTPDAARLTVGADGRMFVSDWSASGVEIKEVVMTAEPQ